MSGLADHIAVSSTPSVDALISWLVKANALTDSALERAQCAAELSHDRVDRVLLKLGLVDEHAVTNAWASILGIAVVKVDDFPKEPLLGDVLASRFLRNAGLLPVELSEQSLKVAAIDPLDQFSITALAARTGLAVKLAVTSPSDFDAAFSRLYPDIKELSEDALGTTSADTIAGDLTRLRDLAADAPTIRFVNMMIERAVDIGASDIHVTIGRAGTRLRYRVDGVLRDVEPHPTDVHSAIISRLKVLADLDIAERRLPQDGRVRFAVRGREIDLRLATMPHLDGEGAVLRILDRSAVRLDLQLLGLPPKIERGLSQLLTEPHGILLVSGPTGSGKTTTLYAALRQLVKPERNVVSVEDPVEYHLEGVAQIQVQRKIGLDFPVILRSVLRQDPDVIMIGEVRDAETASIANQAALTGHFVLATLHTNSAAASLPRLFDMGLEPYLLATTVRGVLAQRLLRTLCQHCSRSADQMDPRAIGRLQHLAAGANLSVDPGRLRRACGCTRCNQTGYAGRVAIAELMVVDDDVRQGILERGDADHLEALARRRGFEPLVNAGIALVLAGKTTLEELYRVTGEGADT